jgi:hypothetical protein
LKKQGSARAVEHAAHHVAHDALRDVAKAARGTVGEWPLLVCLLQVAFVDEDSHERGDRRVRQITAGGSQLFANLGSGQFAAAPKGVHDFQLTLRQFFNSRSGHGMNFGYLDLVLS